MIWFGLILGVPVVWLAVRSGLQAGQRVRDEGVNR